MLKKAKCPVIFGTALIISGCGGTTPHVPFDPGPRPVFAEYSDELWQSLPAEARFTITHDDLACKKYITRVERRASAHNGAPGYE